MSRLFLLNYISHCVNVCSYVIHIFSLIFHVQGIINVEKNVKFVCSFLWGQTKAPPTIHLHLQRDKQVFFDENIQ